MTERWRRRLRSQPSAMIGSQLNASSSGSVRLVGHTTPVSVSNSTNLTPALSMALWSHLTWLGCILSDLPFSNVTTLHLASVARFPRSACDQLSKALAARHCPGVMSPLCLCGTARGVPFAIVGTAIETPDRGSSTWLWERLSGGIPGDAARYLATPIGRSEGSCLGSRHEVNTPYFG
jgi:hypothetical protein